MTIEQTSTALERAMADFAKLDAAYEAKVAREAADPILQKLDEHIAIFKLPDPRHGFDGGRDVFAHLASARHWMVKRTQALRVARSQQLAGVDASRWLSKAAWCRQSEKHYRNVERREEYRRVIMGAAGYPLVREGSDQLMGVAAE
jgi:hypothetical protein